MPEPMGESGLRWSARWATMDAVTARRGGVQRGDLSTGLVRRRGTHRSAFKVSTNTALAKDAGYYRLRLRVDYEGTLADIADGPFENHRYR